MNESKEMLLSYSLVLVFAFIAYASGFFETEELLGALGLTLLQGNDQSKVNAASICASGDLALASLALSGGFLASAGIEQSINND